MSGFNLALSATAEMLSKLTHLDRMPGGGGALDGLRIEIDGTDEALSITWAKPDVARKAAAYSAELREAMRAALASPTDDNRRDALAVLEAHRKAEFFATAHPGEIPIEDAVQAQLHDRSPPPPADAPPPCDGPDESDPPPPDTAAAGTATSKQPEYPIDTTSGPAADDNTQNAPGPLGETSGEDLSRVPPEAPAGNEPADAPAYVRSVNVRARVLAAYQSGTTDPAAIVTQTGLTSDQVRHALKGLRETGRIPKATDASQMKRAGLPPCGMEPGERQEAAAARLRRLGYDWTAIGTATNLGTPGAAAMAAKRYEKRQPAKLDTNDTVAAVLDRIGIGAPGQESKDAGGAAALAPDGAERRVADAGQGGAATMNAASPAPSLPTESVGPTVTVQLPPDDVLIAVRPREDGRFDVLASGGTHIASPAVGRLIAKLSDGSLYGPDVLGPAAGVKPAEIPSLQSAVRLVCGRVGRSLVVVQGIGWRIAR